MGFTLAIQRPLVFCDLETTGLYPETNEIIEIYARRIDNAVSFKTVAEYETKVRMRYPEKAHPAALKVNGYTPEAWADAIEIEDALKALSPIFEGDPYFCGSNPNFDITFLKYAYWNALMEFPLKDVRMLDTAQLAWPLVVTRKVKSASLKALCDYFGISNDGAHGARRDIERTIEVYHKLMARFSR